MHADGGISIMAAVLSGSGCIPLSFIKCPKNYLESIMHNYSFSGSAAWSAKKQSVKNLNIETTR